jgi:hypothetical protein
MIAALRGLDLTEAQQQQVREIMQRHRDEMRTAALMTPFVDSLSITEATTRHSSSSR